jgi:hypothetical protein
MFTKNLFIWLPIFLLSSTLAFARNLEYNGQEAAVYVSPSEPTNIKFPDKIAGGYITNDSAIQLQREANDLIIFTSAPIKSQGEAIIVRLKDKRSFSLRLLPADDINPRDPMVIVDDMTGSGLEELREENDDSKPYEPQDGKYAPPTVLSGFMREMVLFTEYGKPEIQGYEVSSKHRGETIFHDGTMHAKVNSIFIGQKYWGYVIDAENLLDTNQVLNPGTFRLDGTRAVSANRWELAAKPLTNEQDLAGRHKTKIYIITRPK